MKVNFYATLRQITGAKSIEFSVEPGSTIADLIGMMVSKFPQLAEVLLNPDGQLYGHVHVFVNGRDVPLLEKRMDTILSSEDKIDIFPPVGGG